MELKENKNSGTQAMYVVATYNQEAKQVQPMATRPLIPTAGPHFCVVTDFVRTLRTLMLEDVTKAELQEDVALLSISAFPCPSTRTFRSWPWRHSPSTCTLGSS